MQVRAEPGRPVACQIVVLVAVPGQIGVQPVAEASATSGFPALHHVRRRRAIGEVGEFRQLSWPYGRRYQYLTRRGSDVTPCSGVPGAPVWRENLVVPSGSRGDIAGWHDGDPGAQPKVQAMLLAGLLQPPLPPARVRADVGAHDDALRVGFLREPKHLRHWIAAAYDQVGGRDAQVTSEENDRGIHRAVFVPTGTPTQHRRDLRHPPTATVVVWRQTAPYYLSRKTRQHGRRECPAA